MNRFTIPKTCKIEGVAARESTRYAIHGVLCDGENKRLVATDGRTLVAIPVPDMPDGQVTAVLPVAALECYRQHDNSTLKVTREITVVESEDMSARFVNVEGNFPSMSDVLEKPFNEPVNAALAINVTLLKNIADAFGCPVVHIGMKVNPKGEVTGSVLVVPLFDDPEKAVAARAAFMTVDVKGVSTGLPPRKKER